MYLSVAFRCCLSSVCVFSAVVSTTSFHEIPEWIVSKLFSWFLNSPSRMTLHIVNQRHWLLTCHFCLSVSLHLFVSLVFLFRLGWRWWEEKYRNVAGSIYNKPATCFSLWSTLSSSHYNFPSPLLAHNFSTELPLQLSSPCPSALCCRTLQLLPPGMITMSSLLNFLCCRPQLKVHNLPTLELPVSFCFCPCLSHERYTFWKCNRMFSFDSAALNQLKLSNKRTYSRMLNASSVWGCSDTGSSIQIVRDPQVL